MNSVILIGRLCADPEVRYTDGQMAVATFTVAIDRGKDKDGNKKGADFPRVTVFGKQAENCERFTAKGKLIGIQGRIQTGSYKTQSGETRYTTDVVADRVEFLEWKDSGRDNSTQQDRELPEGFQTMDDLDNCPF